MYMEYLNKHNQLAVITDDYPKHVSINSMAIRNNRLILIDIKMVLRTDFFKEVEAGKWKKSAIDKTWMAYVKQ